MSVRTRRAALVSALAICLLMLAPAAQSRRSSNPSIVVTFTTSGTLTATLADGSILGTTSGAPTVIPAGYYLLLLNGPGDCINLPLFELNGPSVAIQDDMQGGEVDTHSIYVDFLPNSTYTWHSDRNQTVVYSFKTSSTIVGSTPPSSLAPTKTSSKTATSQDITGTEKVPYRGRLIGTVSSAGKLALDFKGKSVATLKAGRYTIAVTDNSKTNGFIVKRLAHATVNLTAAAFVGTRFTSIHLTAGKWSLMPRSGKTAYSIVVR